MATTGADSTFVDTNILVYANVPASPQNAAARSVLEALASDGVELWISRQVLREYLSVMTRPSANGKSVPLDDLILDVDRFESEFEIAEDGPSVTAQLLDLLKMVSVGGKQIHDANFVATMLAHGVQRLLTHNVADFRRFAPFIEVIPLVPSS